MKPMVILFLGILAASSASATLDPGPDVLGIYFDSYAENNCLATNAGTPFYAYVILTNPTQPGILAFEFDYENEVQPADASQFMLLGEVLPPQAINVGMGDAFSGTYMVGLAVPVPASSATVLVTWQYMTMSPIPLKMYMRAATPSSIPDGLPAVIGSGDGEVMPVNVSSGGPDRPVAGLNGACTNEQVDLSWGKVKSLYH
jgi:hypothetical protein